MSTEETNVSNEESGQLQKNKKTRIGLVTSTKMDKTITVSVERKLRHPIYGKFVKKSKKFLACLLYTSPSPRDRG